MPDIEASIRDLEPHGRGPSHVHEAKQPYKDDKNSQKEQQMALQMLELQAVGEDDKQKSQNEKIMAAWAKILS